MLSINRMKNNLVKMKNLFVIGFVASLLIVG